MRRVAAAILGAVLLGAGCASDLEILPPTPRDPPAAGGHAAPSTVPVVPRGEGLLDAAAHGERLLEGVVLLDPVRGEGGAASFSVRNEGATDLPDLILAVVFAVPTGDAADPRRPRIVTLEAPLARGEERAFTVNPPSGLPAPPDHFRVLAGPPELLTAAVEGAPGDDAEGTTFLGGLLECVALSTDLTGDLPSVSVGLRERLPSGAGRVLPPLEGQLLLARAGKLLWSGPWIRIPGPSPEDGVRSLRWNLPRGESLAGCSPYLRVRERR